MQEMNELLEQSGQNEESVNANRKHEREQVEKYGSVMAVSYSRTEHLELQSKYQGYLQIYRKKNPDSTAEYFKSIFLNDLREKRNGMYSDEITEKMQKQYKTREYASQVDWRRYISNFEVKTTSKFADHTPLEIENYLMIEAKMLK